uniref:Uncharacterized protein n=1 Tax=Nelumbo nucifera TaxID=4432 RepID=A0A822YE57_NELNU|nr:TPA_asm: hypothetical protein HUJ06_030997 [Nelumbo nucifera]
MDDRRRHQVDNNHHQEVLRTPKKSQNRKPPSGISVAYLKEGRREWTVSIMQIDLLNFSYSVREEKRRGEKICFHLLFCYWVVLGLRN